METNKTYIIDELGKEICCIEGIIPVYEGMLIDDMGAVYKVIHSKLVLEGYSHFYLKVYCKYQG